MAVSKFVHDILFVSPLFRFRQYTMSMSGLEFDPTISEFYNYIRLGVHRYAIFRIEIRKRVVVEKRGEPSCVENENRAIYDF